MHARKILAVAAVTTLYQACAVHAQVATEYPDKAVRVIVAAAAGGASDLPTRMFTQKLAENLGHQFIVDNRAGGAGTEAYILAAAAPPDGYTLLSASAAFTYGQDIYPHFPDPIKDFTPIGMSSRAPYLLVTFPGVQANSVKDLIAISQTKPGSLNFGVTNGGFSHVAAAYFAAAAKIKVVIVPYKGSGPITVDLISGQIHATFGNVLSTLPSVKAGKLRVLAVSTAQRYKTLPEYPTIAESGVPGFDISSWFGWLGPAGVPPSIVQKMSAELTKVARSPDISKKMSDDGGESVGSTPEQFRAVIAVEVPRWRKVVKDAGMRVE